MIVIALGANLPSSAGAPAATLKAALTVLSGCGAPPRAISRFYHTPAWPNPADPPFVNAAALLATRIETRELLSVLHAVESSFGRVRTPDPRHKYAPRTLDLDLIDYDGLVEDGPPKLPHPRLGDRAFVLVPLRDVAPFWRHPVTGRDIGDLIADLGPKAGNLAPFG